MERIALDSLNAQALHREPISGAEKQERWSLYGGMLGLVGGAVASVFGSLLTAASWLVGQQGPGHLLHRLGSAFLISTIPLLIFGASCLDAYEKGGHRIEVD